MNNIVNMFPSKVKEDNDALVHHFIECKLVGREIVKSSSSLKLQYLDNAENCVNIFIVRKFLWSFFVSLFFFKACEGLGRAPFPKFAA